MCRSRRTVLIIILALFVSPVLAQTRKFKDIAPKSTPPALTDQVLGVTGGATDNLYTLSQIQTALTAGFNAFHVTKYANLPAGPVLGMAAIVNDGLAVNCGDTACTTWGTTVTGGGGALNLVVWYNGTNWIIMGATAAVTPIVCNNALDYSESCNSQYLLLRIP